ncbi:hypothetical protein FEM48_Zijuj07G0093700 [Ziziphus jujuba var. spinosa]|uniref:Uncharacterized protein n=1 Tax=Ziziphus jujuba var. spinosa TaxID=714518 RepID=A0A978V3T8_ZIZJJ|nr:hypothetical protein FEM48_Zijuj07G0093700 [Ziziphus jujuba var. spinosa]
MTDHSSGIVNVYSEYYRVVRIHSRLLAKSLIIGFSTVGRFDEGTISFYAKQVRLKMHTERDAISRPGTIESTSYVICLDGLCKNDCVLEALELFHNLEKSVISSTRSDLRVVIVF